MQLYKNLIGWGLQLIWLGYFIWIRIMKGNTNYNVYEINKGGGIRGCCILIIENFFIKITKEKEISKKFNNQIYNLWNLKKNIIIRQVI